ncbi:MAG: prepilin-type N-terminal cleavage/methylation domain-containing protein [Opitutae bacterium]
MYIHHPKGSGKNSGFTLIELMVVIIVIGIVGGIIFSGAGYIFEKQAIKQAGAEIEVLQVALEEYKRQNGNYPETFDFQDEMASFILLHTLHGTHELVDGTWERLAPEKYLKSLIPTDAMAFRSLDEEEDGTFNLNEVDHYLIDPWGEPYIYQFRRKDGNYGFLLYSKGPDQLSAPFSEVSDGQPEKRPEDKDNIPPSEPGKW